MIEKLLLALLVQLIDKMGPILIDIIIKWLSGLSEQEKVALLKSVSDALKDRQVA